MASPDADIVMSEVKGGENKHQIDESLYSRQLYVFGHEAQRKMAQSDVLIVGLRGLGVEIAKNVILAGVRSVGLLDQGNVEVADLGAQFYLSEKDVGQPRAAACFKALEDLNRYVRVHHVAEPLSETLLRKQQYQVVVLTEHRVDEQVQINNLCHSLGIKLIVGDLQGVYASLFVDFGDNHVVSDPDGENPLRGLICNVSQGNPGIVTCHEDSRHGLSTGDLVTFEEVEGMTTLNGSAPRPIKVVTPYSFSIEDTTNYPSYTGSKGYFQQVKLPHPVAHKRLAECLVRPKIVSDYGNSLTLHSVYQAVSSFRGSHDGKFPSPVSADDAKTVVASAVEFAGKIVDQKVAIDEKLAYRVARPSSAQLNPMAAVVGGFLGQEVLKAVSGKFTPLDQQLYFDASLVLPNDELDIKEYQPQNGRYDAQIAVFGRSLQQQLMEKSCFLVGAGAIGCEMLKNFALMGVATAGRGSVHVTDMDNIEKSNLNRQFLFRPSDVGKMKSETAAREAKRMNPGLRVEHANLRVGPQTEDVYDDAFWEKQDVICTALDNVEARLYVDQRCVYYQKPMIDSGTLGTKGNTQVVVPFATESYGASRDPPEESIPICTLKNFPHKIEHTIQWARDNFEGLFKQAPDEVNQYLSNTNYVAEASKQPNTMLTNLKTIQTYLINERPLTFDECIRWARLKFDEEYYANIAQLLHNFPADQLTAQGTPFWSGTKRAPAPLKFDANDPLHMDFIVAAANLHAYNYGLKGDVNPETYKRVLAQVKVLEWAPKVVKIATTEAEAKAMAEGAAAEDDFDTQVKQIVEVLPAPSSLAGYRLAPAEFEKDDDTNFHVAFINAASNLRARNYKIKEVSRHETKQIAGKIIPAIATTTALVTGLVCLEIYKLLQKKPVDAYRNTYVNLALPLLAMSEPMPPAYHATSLKDKPEWKWSLWDRMDVDTGEDITLQEFIDYFQDKFGLEINMLNNGPSLLYNSFGMGDKKKLKERLKMKMSDVVRTVGKIDIRPNEKYLTFEAVVSAEDGEEVEIPYIRYKFRA